MSRLAKDQDAAWQRHCAALEQRFTDPRVLGDIAECKDLIFKHRDTAYTSKMALTTVSVQNRDLWVIHEFIAQQSVHLANLSSLARRLSDEIVRLGGEVARQKALTYRGVHTAGEVYDVGDMVTCGGSLWHCNEITDGKPGEATAAWTLAVKRGRDGKDITRAAA